MSERNYVAEARAQINGVDQTQAVIAAVIYAQAIDRALLVLEANTNALNDNARAVREADFNAHNRYVNQR